MSIADNTEHNILALIFNATPWALIADNAGTTPMTQIACALMSADPLDAGNMTSNELTTTQYVNYARINVPRTSATPGWLVAAAPLGSVSPTASIDFPAGGGASTGVTASFFAVGKTGGGATDILWSGTVSPPIACGNSIQPSLTIATTITLD